MRKARTDWLERRRAFLDEEIEVYGAADRVHLAARGRGNLGGGGLPQGRDLGLDLPQVVQEIRRPDAVGDGAPAAAR